MLILRYETSDRARHTLGIRNVKLDERGLRAITCEGFVLQERAKRLPSSKSNELLWAKVWSEDMTIMIDAWVWRQV
ncbi:MAG: hypothetical protein ACYSUC_12335 [Planctomycetota bacterium]|jgi:hypothetical protein